jgi:hypothetical protein
VAELKDLCTTFYVLIEDLEMKLEKAKVPSPASVSDKAYELRAELKELKDIVLVNEDGINGMGDKPTGRSTYAQSQYRLEPSDREQSLFPKICNDQKNTQKKICFESHE